MTAEATIDAADLRDRLSRSAPPLVIDVRTPGEFRPAHIRGSVSVPLSVLIEHRDRVSAHLGADAVLVCQGGSRAEQARKALAEAGVTGATVLRGGVEGWATAGGELTRDREVWEMERQVRLVAGSIALTGVLASTMFPKAKWAAGFIGGGLTFSALSNTCTMAVLLAKAPWNQVDGAGDPETVIRRLSS